MCQTKYFIIGIVFVSSLAGGCDKPETPPDLVWAVNVGGPDYEGIDGTHYETDSSLQGGAKGRDGAHYAAESSIQGGTIGQLKTVKGTQDAFLYQSFLVGEIEVAHAIPDGVYDITFHFAEPEELEAGERVFDVFAEGRRVIDDLDIMLYRDGKIESALTVTAPNVVIEDGELNINFEPSVGQPTLSALVVRDKNRRQPEWKLVWSDEFDGGELDASRWSPNIWPARMVNGEDQAYTARDKNIRVEDGMLVLEAHKEDYDDAVYTSGRVHSSGKGDFLYGKFEVRAKLPRGMGTWPAIWMLPSDPYKYSTTCDEGEAWQGSESCDAWPNSGEIDIMELVGYQMEHVHGTVHNKAYYWATWEERKGRIVIEDVDVAFHIYSLEWTPERIDIYVDDSHYFSYLNENKGWEAWPYDQPFHLILNVAVGGMWGRSGGGIDDSIFPQRMEVDYVRVYEANTANEP